MPIITANIVETLSAQPVDKLIKLVSDGEAQLVTRAFAIQRAQLNAEGFRLIVRGATVRKMIASPKPDPKFQPCWRNTEAAAYPPWPGWSERLQTS